MQAGCDSLLSFLESHGPVDDSKEQSIVNLDDLLPLLESALLMYTSDLDIKTSIFLDVNHVVDAESLDILSQRFQTSAVDKSSIERLWAMMNNDAPSSIKKYLKADETDG